MQNVGGLPADDTPVRRHPIILEITLRILFDDVVHTEEHC